MSLVLEALRKLDREKGRDERGFVVMAAAPWPTRATRRGPVWVAVGVAVVAALAAVVLMRSPRPAAPAQPAAATAASPSAPAPAPAATAQATPVPASAPTIRRAATPAPVPDGGRRAASPAAQPALRLQAVSERDGKPIAMVNDRLLRVGDEIEGMRVLAIRPDEVDLEIKGRRVTLRF